MRKKIAAYIVVIHDQWRIIWGSTLIISHTISIEPWKKAIITMQFCANLWYFFSSVRSLLRQSHVKMGIKSGRNPDNLKCIINDMFMKNLQLLLYIFGGTSCIHQIRKKSTISGEDFLTVFILQVFKDYLECY